MTEIQSKDLKIFEEAIINKDLKTIAKIIKDKPSIVNEKDTQGKLFLNLAIETDNKIVALLVESGADVNMLDTLGFTPIYNMIKSIEIFLTYDVPTEEIFQTFQAIVARGATLNVQDRRGNTPINYIAQRAKGIRSLNDVYTKVGKMLLTLDKNVSETIQIKNNMGKSPLDYLSRNGNVILRDAVFAKLPHIQEAINRTIAETEAATKKILDSTSDKALS
jgi:ankyrin repeat protein